MQDPTLFTQAQVQYYTSMSLDISLNFVSSTYLLNLLNYFIKPLSNGHLIWAMSRIYD